MNPDKCNHDEVTNLVNFDVPKYLVIDLTPRALLFHKSQEENEDKQIQMKPTINIVKKTKKTKKRLCMIKEVYGRCFVLSNCLFKTKESCRTKYEDFFFFFKYLQATFILIISIFY